ncbi:MAG TPA: LysM peptidoglycan-binding domain-containing protein [Spirochaetota bacterium]|nr:LysM peptidoglycan-binding domain-containing protein [Spirochaetota bacterium]
MSSYYKTIKGRHYDKAMLEEADKSVSKKKDKKISLAEAKKIVNKASDAGKITDVESQTLNYIFENYKFTKAAEEYFSNFVFLEEKEAEHHKEIEEEAGHDPEDIFGIKEFLAKYYLLIIVIALIIFLLYLYSGRISSIFSGTGENVSITEEQKGEPIVSTEPETIPVTAGENEYIVKYRDTLYSISSQLYGEPDKWKALYEKNKDIIEKPSMIYPGQILKTDIK